jgi:hypothetical protein
MADEPIVLLPHHVEVAVQHQDATAERPAPSLEQERVADGVFTDEQTRAAAAILGVQTGLAIAHHLAMETFLKDDEDKQHLPRPARREPEEPDR